MSKKKIVDLTIYMDGLRLDDGEKVEDVINYLKKRYPLPWGYDWEVTHEETFTD